MIDRADGVPADDFQNLLGLGAVEMLVCGLAGTLKWYDSQVGGDDSLGPMALP